MSNFQLSKQADPNKIFLIKFSELEGRFDPNTYHPIRRNSIEKIRHSKFDYQKLGVLSSFAKTIVKNIDNNIYVGLENIESNTGIFVESKQKEDVSSASIFKKGQVLFPKLRPYLNKVHYANFNGVCSTEFHVLDSKYLDNKFLAYFLSLDIVVKQTTLLMSGNTLPRLQTEDIKNLLILTPPKNIQADIVAKMDKAYQDKQKKEAQAQDLLNGIDNYLLSELGIDLPKKIDNSLKSRMFIKKFSDIEGGRFDSVMALYQTTVNNLKYPLQNLGSILQKNPQYGANEVGVGRKSRDEIRYIRITDIDNDGFLKNRLGKTVNNIENQYLLNLDDLLLARSGSVGRAYLHKDTGCKSIFAGYLIRFILDDKKVIPDYIFSYMQCSLYKNWVNAIQRIVAQPNINAEEYKSLKIPLPPLEKQNQIAEHISKIRNQAKQLQLEAKTGLEQVKQEVETMILGDKKNG